MYVTSEENEYTTSFFLCLTQSLHPQSILSFFFFFTHSFLFHAWNVLNVVSKGLRAFALYNHGKILYSSVYRIQK